MSLDEGALLEPMSVAIHAVRRARLQPGAKVLVLGAGAVGLLTAAMLLVAKASSITIADIEARRVEFATENGFANIGVPVPRTRAKSDSAEDKLAHAQQTARVLMDGAHAVNGNGNDESAATNQEQFDFVFECTGVEACVQASIYATAPGGAVLLVGMGTPVQTVPISAAALREVDLLGVFRYANTYPYGLELLANKEKNGLPDIAKLATHHFKGLDKASDAFAMAAKSTEEQGNLVLKVIIEA